MIPCARNTSSPRQLRAQRGQAAAARLELGNLPRQSAPQPHTPLMSTHNEEDIRFAYWVPNVPAAWSSARSSSAPSWDIDYNASWRRSPNAAASTTPSARSASPPATAPNTSTSPYPSVMRCWPRPTRSKSSPPFCPGPWNPALAAKQIATIRPTHRRPRRRQHRQRLVPRRVRRHRRAVARPRRALSPVGGVHPRAPRHLDRGQLHLQGDFYRFNDYTLKPKPLQQPLPEIFQGGSSRAARDMASRVSDWYFTNGNTPEGHQSRSTTSRPRLPPTATAFRSA